MLATKFVDLVTFTSRLAFAQLASPLDGHVGGLPEIKFADEVDVRAHVRNITSQPVHPPF